MTGALWADVLGIGAGGRLTLRGGETSGTAIPAGLLLLTVTASVSPITACWMSSVL
jgi:hypothetical protein